MFSRESYKTTDKEISWQVEKNPGFEYKKISKEKIIFLI